MLDVAVIGGGPAGSRTAFQLAKMGYRVIVLEKRPGIGEKACCTGIISRECTALYDIPAGVIQRYVNSAKIIAPSGEIIQLYRPEVQACIVNRKSFDCALAERAAAAGAEYRTSTGVKNITFQSNRVELEAESEGKSLRFETQAVVIASGFNTILTKQIGAGSTGYYVHGAQFEAHNKDLHEVEIYFDQKLAPGFFAWIVPTNQDRCLIGLLSHQTPGPFLNKWTARLESRGFICSDGIRFGSIPLKPIKRTYGERFLVVGDAAGQVKPTTGGGIYFGMLCADIAADTLHRAFSRGNLSAGMLAEYELAWKKKLGNELRTGYIARKIYEHLRNRQIDGLFARLKKTGLIESVLQQEDLSFDWHGGLVLKAVRTSAASRVKHVFHLPATFFKG